MINKVTLIGNLGQDPELRTLESGAKMARLSVATSENWKDKHSGEWQTKTEWHQVIAWNRLAEIIHEKSKKGMRVYVEGKITYRSWETDSGEKRYATEIVANTIRRLEKAEGTYQPPEPPENSGNDTADASGGSEGLDDLPF